MAVSEVRPREEWGTLPKDIVWLEGQEPGVDGVRDCKLTLGQVPITNALAMMKSIPECRGLVIQRTGLGFRVPPARLCEIEVLVLGRDKAMEKRAKREGNWFTLAGAPGSLSKVDLERLLLAKEWPARVMKCEFRRGLPVWVLLAPPGMGPVPKWWPAFTYKRNQLVIQAQEKLTRPAPRQRIVIDPKANKGEKGAWAQSIPEAWKAQRDMRPSWCRATGDRRLLQRDYHPATQGTFAEGGEMDAEEEREEEPEEPTPGAVNADAMPPAMGPWVESLGAPSNPVTPQRGIHPFDGRGGGSPPGLPSNITPEMGLGPGRAVSSRTRGRRGKNRSEERERSPRRDGGGREEGEEDEDL